MRASHPELFEPDKATAEDRLQDPGLRLRALESADFPFERLSEIAEIESWRKEIYRPLSHIHKWWAQRLGSVFRAMTLGVFAPEGSDILKLFYGKSRIPGAVVFDPFMGSGTTVNEVLKLGGRAIGRDINPVAFHLVKAAVGMPSRSKLIQTFRSIEQDVANEILRYYVARLPDGTEGTVLYYFWVKQCECPSCSAKVDLFSSYVFSQHAYPTRYPQAQALCPQCGEVNSVRYDSRQVSCRRCDSTFDPRSGPAKGRTATCPSCRSDFEIARSIRATGSPPSHRLYAKMVLVGDRKVYLRADDFDLDLFEKAKQALALRPASFPTDTIEPGHNTNQALGYGYRRWHQMFNERQLLCLGVLAARIRQIQDDREREVFCCLFSGTLEFNNMFASFKGEGTGAVRHMFYHHILKPERVPLEANLWGTPRSSGSFSGLFRTRLLRALEYAEDPFEVRVFSEPGARNSGRKEYGLSERISFETSRSFSEFASGGRLYLSCGDSSRTDLASGSVDAVITDPPFFDNVHYSELADFFYVWQRFVLGDESGERRAESTRSQREVQAKDEAIFRERLTDVWRECHRVLKTDGVLVFSYHHSRHEGWRPVLGSLLDAGFLVTYVQPIKAEMSVSTPKHQAKEPIDFDMILVCRKRTGDPLNDRSARNEQTRKAIATAERQVRRLLKASRPVSRNDVRVVITANVVAAASDETLLELAEPKIEEAIRRLCGSVE